METEQRIYDDSVVFINRSNYSKDEFVKLNIILNKRYLRFFLVLGIISLASCIFLTAVCAYLKEFRKTDITLILITAFLGVILTVFYFITPMLVKKNKNVQKDVSYEYLFYEDKFEIFVKSDTISAQENRTYQEIKNALVYNELIFLYVSKVQAYVLKKDVNAERIIEFLQGKGIRFVSIK